MSKQYLRGTDPVGIVVMAAAEKLELWRKQAARVEYSRKKQMHVAGCDSYKLQEA